MVLAAAREERVADGELVENAAERPHVDGCVVGDAEHDFRRAIEPALDISVNLLILETPRTEVDDLNPTFVNFAKKNVFGF